MPNSIEHYNLVNNMYQLEQYVNLVQISQCLGQSELGETNFTFLLNFLLKQIPNSSCILMDTKYIPEKATQQDRLWEKKSAYERYHYTNIVSILDHKQYMEQVKIPFLAKFKLEGYQVRIIYQNGNYIRATLYHKQTIGKDVTDLMKQFCPSHLAPFKELQLLEIVGTLTLSKASYSKLSQTYLTLYSAVTYAIQSGVNLDGLAFVAEDILTDQIPFTNCTQKMALLQKLGFNICPCLVIKQMPLTDIDTGIANIIQQYAVKYHDYDYPMTSLLELDINEVNIQKMLPKEVLKHLHNISIDAAKYINVPYVAQLKSIEWLPTSTYLKPRLIVYVPKLDTTLSIVLDKLFDLLPCELAIESEIKLLYNTFTHQYTLDNRDII